MVSPMTPIQVFQSNFHRTIYIDVDRPEVKQRLDDVDAKPGSIPTLSQIFPGAPAISKKQYMYYCSDCPQQPSEEAREHLSAFLDFGCYINMHSYFNRGLSGPILSIAAIHGQAEVARLLQDRGASVDCRDNVAFTPLIHSGVDMARFLISRGADVNATCPSNRCSALFMCDAPTAQLSTKTAPDANDGAALRVIFRYRSQTITNACWRGVCKNASKTKYRRACARQELHGRPRTMDKPGWV